MYDYMGFGMGGYMGLFWIIPIGLIIWAAIVVRDSNKEQEQSAQTVLKARYAKGEIDRQEFEQKRHDLEV